MEEELAMVYRPLDLREVLEFPYPTISLIWGSPQYVIQHYLFRTTFIQQSSKKKFFSRNCFLELNCYESQQYITLHQSR